jgi:dihydrolipoamide dehydrogenase
VVGGGIIGLEMATVYDALGSAVTVVELADQIIPGCDPDLVRPLHKRITGRYTGIHLNTRVEGIEAREDGLHATFSGDLEDAVFDRVLVSVGRIPNGAALDLHRAGVHVDEHGFVPVDEQQRTNVPHVYAIGDIAGPPLLAHKASHEGHVAAEVIAGHDVSYDVRAMPSVAYTEPEVAWVGLTEIEAKEAGPRTRRRSSRGRRPAARSASTGPPGRPSCSSTPRPTASSARASSAPTRASSSPRSAWRSRWAPTSATSA